MAALPNDPVNETIKEIHSEIEREFKEVKLTPEIRQQIIVYANSLVDLEDSDEKTESEYTKLKKLLIRERIIQLEVLSTYDVLITTDISAVIDQIVDLMILDTPNEDNIELLFDLLKRLLAEEIKNKNLKLSSEKASEYKQTKVNEVKDIKEEYEHVKATPAITIQLDKVCKLKVFAKYVKNHGYIFDKKQITSAKRKAKEEKEKFCELLAREEIIQNEINPFKIPVTAEMKPIIDKMIEAEINDKEEELSRLEKKLKSLIIKGIRERIISLEMIPTAPPISNELDIYIVALAIAIQNEDKEVIPQLQKELRIELAREQIRNEHKTDLKTESSAQFKKCVEVKVAIHELKMRVRHEQEKLAKTPKPIVARTRFFRESARLVAHGKPVEVDGKHIEAKYQVKMKQIEERKVKGSTRKPLQIELKKEQKEGSIQTKMLGFEAQKKQCEEAQIKLAALEFQYNDEKQKLAAEMKSEYSSPAPTP